MALSDVFFSLFGSAPGRQSFRDIKGQIQAINRSQAIIEFDLDGRILAANQNFLDAMDYSLEEIRGKHHSLFVAPDYANSAEYRAFWEKLRRGEYDAGEYKRIAKNGKEVWIQATYNPILDRKGRPRKIIKFATDVTTEKLKAADHIGQIEAIGRSQAVIEFALDGTILTANENFLSTMGYSLNEIEGRQHSIFVDAEDAASADYKTFWAKLRRGEFQSGVFRRFAKGGRQVWIRATYNPIHDTEGNLVKVVKFAIDITEQTLQQADYAGQIDAINKSQAVVEFDLQGRILNANGLFLQTMGYTMDEIRGKHHSLFAEPEYAHSQAYQAFWEKLRQGEFDSGEYKRLGKHGKEIWIQASYNPIFDPSGKPYKVVKYATDVTAQKLTNADYSGQIEAIGKSQAVIEFAMDGTIQDANDNFLETMGYRIEEIKGQHHRMFADPDYASSAEYRAFWDGLRRGEYQSGEYLRFGKNGKNVWIHASYNPILDLNGSPFKVVKYASDITEQKHLALMIEECLTEANVVMSAISAGDLSKAMVGSYTGEFAALKDAVNATVEKLRDIVQAITEAASSINASAGEIAKGNVDLSNRTSKQAANLEETAASAEQLGSTIKQNASNAEEANRLAADARQQAEHGGTVIGTAIEAMTSIKESSKRIADIIGVIDEIAFQTNLLALNASVEAARAGEQGRGFSVVASEVRNLAQRSADSAKEIRTLIRDSVKNVDEGSRLVDDSGETLREIVGSVGNVSGIISQIAAASVDQANGIAHVNQAVSQIDDATQQNAALVEQAAAASTSMDEQSRSLLDLVGFFRIENR